MMSEEMKSQQIEMLIRFYNMQAGTSFRVGKPENRSAVNSAIERANGDIVKVKNAVREWVNNHNDDMQSGGAVIVCFDTILCEKKEEPKPEPEEKTEEKHEQKVRGRRCCAREVRADCQVCCE